MPHERKKTLQSLANPNGLGIPSSTPFYPLQPDVITYATKPLLGVCLISPSCCNPAAVLGKRNMPCKWVCRLGYPLPLYCQRTPTTTAHSIIARCLLTSEILYFSLYTFAGFHLMFCYKRTLVS